MIGHDGDQEKGSAEGDHPRRQQRRQDLADEPVREQALLEPVQGHDRGGLPHQGGRHRRSGRDDADLGHCRPGALPVARSGVLPRGGLLRAGVRYDRAEHVQESRLVAGRVPDPGEPPRSGPLPVRRARQQDRSGEPRRVYETCPAVVPGEERYSLL